jgi:predicted  nucleic acid-binding Zn-ribbon protein
MANGTLEERVDALEKGQEEAAVAMQAIFGLVQNIDRNMTNVVERTAALEKNFSLLNAKVDGLDEKFEALDAKVETLDRKVDAIPRAFAESFREFRQELPGLIAAEIAKSR